MSVSGTFTEIGDSELITIGVGKELSLSLVGEFTGSVSLLKSNGSAFILVETFTSAVEKTYDFSSSRFLLKCNEIGEEEEIIYSLSEKEAGEFGELSQEELAAIKSMGRYAKDFTEEKWGEIIDALIVGTNAFDQSLNTFDPVIFKKFTATDANGRGFTTSGVTGLYNTGNIDSNNGEYLALRAFGTSGARISMAIRPKLGADPLLQQQQVWLGEASQMSGINWDTQYGANVAIGDPIAFQNTAYFAVPVGTDITAKNFISSGGDGYYATVGLELWDGSSGEYTDFNWAEASESGKKISGILAWDQYFYLGAHGAQGARASFAIKGYQCVIGESFHGNVDNLLDLIVDDSYLTVDGGINITELSAGSAQLRINSQQVVGPRASALPSDATDLASAIALVNAIKAGVKTTGGHGLFAD